MNEGDLKTRLKKALLQAMPGAVVFNHTGAITSGIPDLSCTWGGTTSWIEVKFARAGRQSRPTPLQAQTLVELSSAGAPSFLLIYSERTERVAQLDYYTDKQAFATEIPGFDHAAIALVIRKTHEVRG